MAHFAEIDSNNIVLRVLVVDNNDLLDSENNESEALGITYLTDAFGGNWKQTSYNRNFRKNYAGKGCIYDSARDAFYGPQPYASWTLDEDTCIWEAPVTYPDDGKMYEWDEDTTNWVETE
jgi:hypothetical protein